MARTMAEAVVLRDPGSGAPVVLLPGRECPEWAEPLITNEAVFADASEPEGEPEPDPEPEIEPAKPVRASRRKS